jgi:hypothetical protein
MTIGYHLTFRLADDRVIAPDAPAFRRAAVCFHRHGRLARLVAFCVVDTHAHALVVCGREVAQRFARSVALALQRTLAPGIAFERTRLTPVVDQRHLYSTFHYILRQHQHHRVSADPFHDGSHLPDVAGLRVLDSALDDAVRGYLPRVEIVLPPRGDLLLADLPDAAAAALALPHLRAKTPRTILGRAAIVQLGVDHPTRDLADVLELGRSTVKRLRAVAVPATVLRAVEGQARWRSAAAGAIAHVA